MTIIIIISNIIIFLYFFKLNLLYSIKILRETIVLVFFACHKERFLRSTYKESPYKTKIYESFTLGETFRTDLRPLRSPDLR